MPSSKLSIAVRLALLLSSPAGVSAFSAVVVREPMAIVKGLSKITGNKSLVRRRTNSVTSRLQYCDGAEDPQAGVMKWWNNVFTPREANAENNKQEVVDEYLEFLDRRYKRLRSAELEEKSKNFSALSWLMQGSQSKKDLVATEQQKDDSLYVLGVAGLASEKLLQKHHLVIDKEQQGSVATAANKQLSPIESTAMSDSSILDVECTPSDRSVRTMLAKEVVVPCIRTIYSVKRRLQFVKEQKRRLTEHALAMVKSLAVMLIKGPVNTTKAVLDIGGGKKNITMTFTVVYFALLLLRPILQAALTEGQVGA